jgi:hypothetical protein
MGLATAAVAYWRPRPSLAETWRQYRRYAEGDALAGMYPERHLLRFAAYSAAAMILWSRRPSLMAGLAVGAVAHSYRPVRRAWGRLPGVAAERAAALLAVPALLASVDAAKMWGYVHGTAARLLRRPEERSA